MSVSSTLAAVLAHSLIVLEFVCCGSYKLECLS